MSYDVVIDPKAAEYSILPQICPCPRLQNLPEETGLKQFRIFINVADDFCCRNFQKERI